MEYSKEKTIHLQLSNGIRIGDLITAIEDGDGVECLLAVVPKQIPGSFELTFSDSAIADKYAFSFEFADTEIKTRYIGQIYRFVSIMFLPVYITDDEVLDKLTKLGVEPVSPVKRRLIRRDSGSRITDGTRIIRCRFPPGIEALPTGIKFATAEGSEFFKIRHDNQKPVCHICLSTSHKFRECPSFVCFKCGKQGHKSYECREDEYMIYTSNEDFPTPSESVEISSRMKATAKRRKHDHNTITIDGEECQNNARTPESDRMDVHDIGNEHTESLVSKDRNDVEKTISSLNKEVVTVSDKSSKEVVSPAQYQQEVEPIHETNEITEVLNVIAQDSKVDSDITESSYQPGTDSQDLFVSLDANKEDIDQNRGSIDDEMSIDCSMHEECRFIDDTGLIGSQNDTDINETSSDIVSPEAKLKTIQTSKIGIKTSQKAGKSVINSAKLKSAAALYYQDD